MTKGLIGIIGGSGLYSMEGVEITDEKAVDTPFGAPSDAILVGKLEGKDVAFLPRHGRGHLLPPHQINYRANIFALKKLGVESIISVSAVGSMKEKIKPGDLVMVDQFVDRTKVRFQTFYDDGIAVHVGFADPVCEELRSGLVMAARTTGAAVHDGGTYICIEGPMFSSRAESNIYRSWGVDVIGMTNYQEAKLAREAEICYATIALATDYDCWHEQEGPVDVAMVIKILQENVSKAQATIRALLPKLKVSDDCPCRHALKDAIITDRRVVSDEVKKRLDPLIGRYLKE
jgi:5'-methylthioadenosine phosphorylase